VSVSIVAHGPHATRALGGRITTGILQSTRAAAVPLLVTLSGDLGAGKTTFVGGLLEAFGNSGPARSPTYTLIEPYRLAGRDLYHCDLYRLRHPDELEDLGLRDLRRPGSVLLVEWPEQAAGRLGAPDVTVEFLYEGDTARRVTFAFGTDVGAEVLAQL
jgi:tRNA threonylcarbamoyladenosine biosynthesis protein TsaE